VAIAKRKGSAAVVPAAGLLVGRYRSPTAGGDGLLRCDFGVVGGGQLIEGSAGFGNTDVADEPNLADAVNLAEFQAAERHACGKKA